MSSRCMSLLLRTTLHSDSEQHCPSNIFVCKNFLALSCAQIKNNMGTSEGFTLTLTKIKLFAVGRD
jgi:hypothetical protein